MRSFSYAPSFQHGTASASHFMRRTSTIGAKIRKFNFEFSNFPVKASSGMSRLFF